jgi:L-fuconolactonase
MKVDAHQHYWDISRTDYGWLTPERGVLYNNYLPEQLIPVMQSFNFPYSVAVQAAPSIEETHYLLALSDSAPSLIGVVGWLDFESSLFQDQFAELCKHPKFVGVRPMIQDLPEDWLLRPAVVSHIQHMERVQFAVDLQLRPHLLGSAIALMEQAPRLKAIIDHIAKPVWGECMDNWRSSMRQLAAYPNMMCKLSGLVPESSASWTVEQLRPYVEYVIDVFGHERVVFGSDWPVCLLSASYEQVYEALNGLLPADWSDEQREGVWGRNAIRFYGLTV